MEYYYGILIVVIVLKMVFISIYCCVRVHRLNTCRSDRPKIVVVDGTAAAAATRARIERRNQNDRLSIVGHAEPMGTSPPPHLSVKSNRGPPSYEQSTVDQNPNHQNRNPHGSFPQGPHARGPYRPEPNARGPYRPEPNAHGSFPQGRIGHDPYPQDPNAHGSFPQGPSARGPYSQDPNVHGSFPLGPSASGPYPLDPNARRPFQQDPHVRASYPRGPNAPAPYTQDPNALGLSYGDAQAPNAPAAEPLPQSP